MIRTWALWTAFCLSIGTMGFPAFAAPGRVASGAHDGFSRLTVEVPLDSEWQLGRVIDGYALRTNSGNLGYDLQAVFDRIGKERLAAIWVDPTSGDLVFSLGCECHAQPFEFRPGIVVIDLKDGPPPKGSDFELPLPGDAVQEQAMDMPPPRPGLSAFDADPGAYSWLEGAMAHSVPPKAADVDRPADPALPSDQAQMTSGASAEFRESLLEQMAAGATLGLLTLRPTPDASGATGDPALLANLTVQSVIPTPNLSSAERSDDLTENGLVCLDPALVAISDWAEDEKQLGDQLSAVMSDLVGEFDRVDPKAVERLVQLLLHMGFGAEARAALAAFPETVSERELFTAMSYLVDGEEPETPYFQEMIKCDSAAALWALLEIRDKTAEPIESAQPILLAFSGLPVQLRRNLGALLAEQFLVMGDVASAQAIQDAIQRATKSDDEQGQQLMSAKLALAQGDSLGAATAFRELADANGPESVEALIALIELLAEERRPIPAEHAETLKALIGDQSDDTKIKMNRALILVLAGSGSFDEAFQLALEKQLVSVADLFGFLANVGTDEDLLTHGVFALGVAPPKIRDDEALMIATRLEGLGLQAAGQAWRSVLPADTTMDEPAGDTPLALAPENQTDGGLAPAEGGFADTSWQDIAANDQGDWGELARYVLSPAAEPPVENGAFKEGPIGRGKSLLEEAPMTRQSIEALLAAANRPAP